MTSRIEKPKTKEAFATMLHKSYGYSVKLSLELANIVAGHGAFNPILHDEDAMDALYTLKSMGYSAEEVTQAMEATDEN